MQTHEYVAIDLPGRSGNKAVRDDDALTERLNQVAAHGWRLVSVMPKGQYGGGFGIFERAVDGNDG